MFEIVRRQARKKAVIVAIFVFTFLISAEVFITVRQQSALFCDETTLCKYMKTPEGLSIPDFNISVPVRSFGRLRQTCEYVDDKIFCPDVRHYGETVFRQSQLAVNRMLNILHIICERYQIPYWLSYGSLIGAVRHNGNVPWDHDADIAMTVEGYKRFLTIVRQDLPSDIFFQDGSDEPEYLKYKNIEAKLRDSNSCYGSNIGEGLTFHDGLMVDIFLWNVTQNKMGKFLKSWKYEAPDLFYDDVFPLKEVDFDGIKLMIPNKAKKILPYFYGDFMTLPANQYPAINLPIPWLSCKYLQAMPIRHTDALLEAFKFPG